MSSYIITDPGNNVARGARTALQSLRLAISTSSPTTTSLAAIAVADSAHYPLLRLGYRRHQPFAVATLYSCFENAPLNTAQWAARKIKASPHSVDLLGPMFLHMHLDRLYLDAGSPLVLSDTHYAWVNDIGHAAISSMDIKVGETVMERSDGMLMHVASHGGIRGAGIDDAAMRGDFNETEHGNASSVPGEARIFSSVDRHLYTDLQFSRAHSLDTYFPLLALQSDSLNVEIDLRSWLDLVRCYDTTTAAYLSDAVIAANVAGGQMLACNLCFTGLFLDSAQRDAMARTKSWDVPFRFVKRDVGPLSVLAAQERTENVMLDAHNLAAQYLFFYRRLSAIGSGSPKKYFEFSSNVPDALVPSPLNTAGTPGAYWPVTPFADVEFRVNDVPRISGPGEYFMDVNAYLGAQRRMTPAAQSYACQYNMDLEPFNFREPSGEQEQALIDNVTMNVVWRNTHTSLKGVAEQGELYVYVVAWNLFRLKQGRFGLRSPGY